MKAILIDPIQKRVIEIDILPGIEPIYKAIECTTFECVNIEKPNTIYIDGEGTFLPDPVHFVYKGLRPLIGRALILGYNAEGESIDTTLALAYVKSRVSFPATKNLTAFDKWLDTFISEKGLDTDHIFEVEGKKWGTNFIQFEALIEAIKGAPKREQEAIKTMIVKIDFVNGDVMDYFLHLAKAIAL